MLQAARSRVLFPDEVTGFSNWPIPFKHTLTLGWTYILIKLSARNLLWSVERLVRQAKNLTNICYPIV
jgi:hypothetical protein